MAGAVRARHNGLAVASGAQRLLQEQWPRRLAWSRTPPFHGGNTGSNPVGVTPHSGGSWSVETPLTDGPKLRFESPIWANSAPPSVYGATMIEASVSRYEFEQLGKTCSLVIGSGAVDGLSWLLAEPEPPSQILVVHDSHVPAAFISRIQDHCRPHASHMAVQSSEEAKTLQTVDAIWHWMAGARFDRHSAIIAVGGGIVSDVAGFAAATYGRGIRFVVVPTTLLSMVDAAIGGKTGINLRMPDGSLAKNLVGSVWVPEAVVADVDALASLPDRHLRSGLAECLKHALLADHTFAEWIVTNRAAILARSGEVLTDLVQRSANVKLKVVVEDPLEHGARITLNMGHTYAHAIESRHSDKFTHGEAVGIGLVAATAAAVKQGVADPSLLLRVRGWLKDVGLPGSLQGVNADISKLTDAMSTDKKRKGGSLRLILPRSAGGAEVVHGPSLDVVAAGWAAVA